MQEIAEQDTLFVKHAIEQALFTYARGVDRKDWDLVRSSYHPDAVDTHGDYHGGIDGFVDHLAKRHENIEQSIHLVTNVLIERTSASSALVESYYVCYQRLKSADRVEAAFAASRPAANETLQLMAVGRYVDRFECRMGEWKIAQRKVTFDVLQATPTPLDGGLSPSLLLSRRDRGDILWQELEGK